MNNGGEDWRGGHTFGCYTERDYLYGDQSEFYGLKAQAEKKAPWYGYTTCWPQSGHKTSVILN